MGQFTLRVTCYKDARSKIANYSKNCNRCYCSFGLQISFSYKMFSSWIPVFHETDRTSRWIIGTGTQVKDATN